MSARKLNRPPKGDLAQPAQMLAISSILNRKAIADLAQPAQIVAISSIDHFNWVIKATADLAQPAQILAISSIHFSSHFNRVFGRTRTAVGLS